MNKYRFLNHPDGKLDIVDAQPELEISKPLYIDLNEIQ